MITSPTRLGALTAASALALACVSPTSALASPTTADREAAAAASATGGKSYSAGQSATDLTEDLTAEDLVASLVGSGIEYSNVTYTGADEAAGTVSGMDAIGLESGVALSSGSVAGSDFGPSAILGPNDSSSTTSAFDTPGDADLDEIVSPQSTNDASVLEFDFVPDTDQLTFTYVFGSEEYNEFVDSSFNDVFAFFVNGENCAVVDTGDGEAPVTVNTINNDLNSALYNDNDMVAGHPFDTELDGFTDPLTCVANVNAGESNHVKLAIADTADWSYDSAVVIGSGSFKANNPPVADDAVFTTPVDTPVDTPLTATDPEGDELTYTVVDGPETGELSGEAPDLTYTPEEGFIGEETFTFLANDGAEDSNVATVTVVVEEPAATPDPTTDPTTEPPVDPTTEPTDSPAPSPSPSDDPKPGEELPRTGTNVGLAAGLGALLTAGGGALLFLARRRKLQG